MEKDLGGGTAGSREDKVVFHFCSGGVCPPQTITMLLHYHGNSSIGARDSKESSFVAFGSVAAFCCLFSSSAGDEGRGQRIWGSGTLACFSHWWLHSLKTETFSPMIPRCHVVISHVNMFRQQFSTQLVYQSYIFLIRQVFWLLVSFYLNCVCTRQVLLLINAA